MWGNTTFNRPALFKVQETLKGASHYHSAPRADAADLPTASRRCLLLTLTLLVSEQMT